MDMENKINNEEFEKKVLEILLNAGWEIRPKSFSGEFTSLKKVVPIMRSYNTRYASIGPKYVVFCEGNRDENSYFGYSGYEYDLNYIKKIA